MKREKNPFEYNMPEEKEDEYNPLEDDWYDGE